VRSRCRRGLAAVHAALSARLIVTALSVPLLKEHADARNRGAILLGLAGVLTMLRPSASALVTWGALAALASGWRRSNSALLWGIAIDRVVWHVPPSMRVCLGGGLVMASGLYLIWHERTRAAPCHHNSHGSGARGKAECRADRQQWKTSLANKRKTHHEHRRYPWTIHLARVVDD